MFLSSTAITASAAILQSVEANSFDLLARPVREIAAERGFTEPTEPQAQAIRPILDGRNVLLIAPTASGKTEAAVLPVFSVFLTNRDERPGIKIIYITPLRALNRDLLERLQWWGQKLDIRLAVRHGDTETGERARQAKQPPDMLITTPETLQAIMPGRVLRQHLRAVQHVIIDEVHELAEDKRGSQLALALERLRWIAQREFQVIGLSATIGTPEVVANFLVGTGRDCTVLHVPVARSMQLKVLYPHPEPQDTELASRLCTHPEVAARLRLMKGYIENHRSVLLFTNTRSIAEVLASRFKVWDIDFPISIHHGSLAKPARLAAERGLKNGELRGLVATSSLELGIDIGRMDFVIQYMSPRQVTRLIQRLGRSGHSVGQTADGVVIAMDSDDTLEAMAIARRTLEENLEPVALPNLPLDVLCHQLSGLLIQKSRWYFTEILELFRKAYSYRDLSEHDLKAVLNYMHTRFPRLAWVSFEDQVMLRSKRIKDLYNYYFGKLSMIPDEKQYLVVDQNADTPIGVLDEAFVAEYGEPGTRFIIRGSPWKMLSIRGEKILVKPISDPSGAVPSWVGEEIPVPFEIGQEVGSIRRYAAEEYQKGTGPDDIARELASRYPADEETILRALSETFEQVDRGLDVPNDRLLTIEDWQDCVVIDAHFGLLVNRTLARVLGHILSEQTGSTIGVQQDPYRVVLQAGGAVTAKDVADTLSLLDAGGIGSLVVDASKKTGIFKRRMVHVARRFGAISRWVDLTNLSLKQLMKSFEGTVIMDEAVKETMEKDLDVANTQRVLSSIKEGSIQVVVCDTSEDPTPIARIGLERISRKTDLVPPESMKRILLESTKARILNEVRSVVCTGCWDYFEMVKMKDLETRPRCQKCKSYAIAVTNLTLDDLRNLGHKRARRLSERDEWKLKRINDSAGVVAKNGRLAAYVLAGRRLDSGDAKRIIRREKRASNRFFEMIMQAEREALRKRFL